MKMSKYQQSVGSIVLDQRNPRFCPAFSGTSFRRKIFDAMLCGLSKNRLWEDSEFKPVEKENFNDKKSGGFEKLSDLLCSEASEGSDSDFEEMETKRKTEFLLELQNVVKKLQFEDSMQREAAMEVRRYAKDDPEARETLALLGAIPPLVGYLDSNDIDLLVESLYALLNLGIGNDLNKAAIVKAGALHKMIHLLEDIPKQPISEAIVANFLGLSALDSNKPIIGASGAVPFLIKTLIEQEHINSQSKQDALRALYNLSICTQNIPLIIESNIVDFLLNSIGDMDVTEKTLSIIGNLVSASEGRSSIRSTKDSFAILVDVLNWSDSPECQEKALYILMVLAYKGYQDRQSMIDAGIMSSLFELTLLGSTLSQKRASRLLECLRMDKGKEISGVVVSAPLCNNASVNDNQGLLEDNDEISMMSEERRAVKQLVQQSLQTNMRRIVKRANLPQDFAPSEHFKTLTSSSTSKSLPF